MAKTLVVLVVNSECNRVKGKNLLELLSFKKRPLLEGLPPPGKQAGSHESCLPSQKCLKDGGVPIYLKKYFNTAFLFLLSIGFNEKNYLQSASLSE